MAEFDTTKNKLRKLWEEIEKNKSSIEDKDNTDKINFLNDLFIQQHIKTPIEIFNSGNKILSQLSTVDSTAVKGEKIPANVSYSQTIDLELPEALLPFVKYSINVTTQPNSEIHGVFVSDPSFWVGDNIDVRGDGVIIYKGQPIVQSSINDFFITHSDEFLISAGISFTLTKETWLVELESSTRGSHSGKILQIDATEILNVNSCLSNDDTKVFTVEHFDNKNHKITEFTSTGFTGIGNEVITTYTPDGGGGCNVNIITNTNVTRTINFSTINNYGLALAEQFDIGLRYDKAEITDLNITKENRWLFYSTELNSIFKTIITGNDDGDFQEIELGNLPNGLASPPYTQITLKRNLEGTNPSPIIRTFSENNLNTRTIKVSKSKKEYENYIRFSKKEGNIPKWTYRLNGDFLYISDATELIFITRSKNSISTQEFESVDTNEFQALIDKNENTKLTGKVANIFYKNVTQGVEGQPGSVTKEFFTDPNGNSAHGITALTSTQFTAVGDEVETLIPIDPELPPVVTKRNNIIQIGLIFANSTDHSITIIDTTDFPVYNDIYTLSGDIYILTTENHTLLSKEVWGVASTDLILNIRAFLVNPLYWREERKYNKNDI